MAELGIGSYCLGSVDEELAMVIGCRVNFFREKIESGWVAERGGGDREGGGHGRRVVWAKWWSSWENCLGKMVVMVGWWGWGQGCQERRGKRRGKW
ncbi:hypothetical protein Pyn_28434 [Prunus yedoensis var. nudiflora]|uniref:Uncharacterized protein n=1 Tax=Prunus yedoensis var. nudiflora TaxID=2094558 RepID=A0A314V0B2_PRUYE|nr:hypothetical protein Pyn_28434 [Prunus yedoensis var. nudiflora]